MTPQDKAAAEYAERVYNPIDEDSRTVITSDKECYDEIVAAVNHGATWHKSTVEPVLREALEALEQCKKYIVDQRMRDGYVFSHESCDAAQQSITNLKNILG